MGKRNTKDDRTKQKLGSVEGRSVLAVYLSPSRRECKCMLHRGDGLRNRCLSTLFSVVMTAMGITQSRNSYRGRLWNVGWGGGGNEKEIFALHGTSFYTVYNIFFTILMYYFYNTVKYEFNEKINCWCEVCVRRHIGNVRGEIFVGMSSHQECWDKMDSRIQAEKPALERREVSSEWRMRWAEGVFSAVHGRELEKALGPLMGCSQLFSFPEGGRDRWLMEQRLVVGDGQLSWNSEWWMTALNRSNKVDQMAKFWDIQILGLVISEAYMKDNES